MQTFLPYADFEQTAKCLDYRRLGKQRVETWQLYQAIIGNTKGWVNHPAAKMWRGYECALLNYGIAMCDEWKGRGYQENMRPRFLAALGCQRFLGRINVEVPMPTWFGDEDFHASHRSNLLRKDKQYYSQFGWIEADDMPYIWPKP